ncbi:MULTISPECIES: hypothetical protein [Dyella]|uniref:Uncharacterized protein n=2 Tax=Dyella TaxID=231454 RepID=A0A4R0YSL1_9GAMM|nr:MULTISPECIES: hypothetical protein [Dyella]TBR40094.1 hypothetical protein EYV96_07935 [Dyella terrae]TCI12323.1 hypothetical protein EZM97_02935 [Dyella soli]
MSRPGTSHTTLADRTAPATDDKLEVVTSSTDRGLRALAMAIAAQSSWRKACYRAAHEIVRDPTSPAAVAGVGDEASAVVVAMRTRPSGE